jgi:mono/diheme cytochrome c family protein
MSVDDPSQVNRAAASARTPPRTRAFVLGMAAGIILTIALITFVGLPLSLAHRAEFPLEGAFGQFAVNLISSLNAGNAANPLPNDSKTLADGEDLYNNNCASCHGDKGDGKGLFENGYYPPPANLIAASTQSKSDAQLRWIIKNGLSFTAMAAYPEFDDQQLWSLVTYIRSLKTH